MRRISCILGALLLGLLFFPGVADAGTTGNIAGTVTDKASGKPLAGVTVTVSGPALQGEQTEFTDASGRYIITELPPGEYVVRFYFSTIKVERPGVFLNADKTLPVSVAMPTAEAKTQTYRITERAPSVDVANTQVQTQVTNELVQKTPVPGRNFTAVLTLAPGATTDPVGFSFNGATGPENNFLIDGLNTTNPAYGTVGTTLPLEFIKETEVITGGYNAEYGRATGGIVNVITKSGSNEFHGGAWFYYTPFQLDPERVARLGEAIVTQSKIANAFDFGFDIGGPIIKDRIWFYAGFNPQFQTTHTTRIIRQRLANNLPMTAASGTYNGDIDTAQQCNSYFADPILCVQGGFKTQDLDKKYWKEYDSPTSSYGFIGKLSFQINENNSFYVQYLGRPSTVQAMGVGYGTEAAAQRQTDDFTHDVVARFVSKLLDRKLQLDVLVGYHREDTSQKAVNAAGNRPAVSDNRTQDLAFFETNVDPCLLKAPRNGNAINANPATPTSGVTFNPCPVANYRYGGVGYLNEATNERIAGALGATYFARLAGTHAIKLGGDFEYVTYTNNRWYSYDPANPGNGNSGSFSILTDGTILRQVFATVDPKQTDPLKEVVPLPKGFKASTTTMNESLYLRDSWNVGFVPGLTINAGLRWEAQQVKDINDKTVIGIYDNLAPRVGFVYDFTRKGYSKIYASYGRFYESIPLDINDRQFSAEGILIQTTAGTGGPCITSERRVGPDGKTMFTYPTQLDPSKCMLSNGVRSDLNGGEFGKVSPVIKGQYSNEVVAGLQYDVGLDMVLGAAYIHRDLGRVIEDLSPDGGHTYIVANPGDETDQGTVKDLQKKIEDLNNQIKTTSDPTKQAELVKEKNETVSTLQLYNGVKDFAKPTRDYNAMVLTAQKRFSHNFQVLASYTYSRTLGNYPGLFQASNGQLDPNISSQYDLKELLENRNGPLPNDRPHNFKFIGNYLIPLGGGGLNIGLQFNAFSGRPIEVLGRHPLYGRRETFILPRGAGGRTPMVTSLDLHLSYERQFSKLIRLALVADVFNVLDQHAVTNVDDEYTADRVMPIKDGTYKDLAYLKTTQNRGIVVNTNFGQPTAYQAPLSMRFGIRVNF